MKHWINAHHQAFVHVLKKLRAAPLSNLLMAAVMGATLSLPAGMYLIVDNLRGASANISVEPQISVFVSLNAPQDASRTLEKKLREHQGIKSVEFISRDTVWRELQQTHAADGGDIGLERNPLPDVFVIHPTSTEPGSLEVLQQELAQWPNVEHAQLDAAWVKRLYALLQLGNKAVVVLAGLLGFALMAIVGNTIRLQILTQREEIEVSRLIGATDRFIRRPFLHAGALQGLAGGAAAWVILSITTVIFNRTVQELAFLYASDFRLTMLDSTATLYLLAGSTLLGWLAAWLAVGRHLAALKT